MTVFAGARNDGRGRNGKHITRGLAGQSLFVWFLFDTLANDPFLAWGCFWTNTCRPGPVGPTDPSDITTIVPCWGRLEELSYEVVFDGHPSIGFPFKQKMKASFDAL